MSNFDEIKETVFADSEERYKRLVDWFMSIKTKSNTNNGLLDLISNETELNGLPIWQNDIVYEEDIDPPFFAQHFADWLKQQMMKDAVDAVYCWDNSFSPVLPLHGFNEGDKVKLIIIKED